MAAAFAATPLSSTDLAPALKAHPAPPPPPALLQRANVAWPRADGYFFRCLALLQRLQEASRAPSKDLSSAEVQACSNLTAHLVYLQRQARATLRAGCAALAAVRRAVAALDEDQGVCVQQEVVDRWWACLQLHVPVVEDKLRWGVLMLKQTALPHTHAGMLVRTLLETYISWCLLAQRHYVIMSRYQVTMYSQGSTTKPRC